MTARHALRAGMALLLLITYSAAYSQANVQALADRWAQAYNRHDDAALGALYAADARLMLHGASTITGREAIREFWARDIEVDNPLTLLTVTHSVTGSDMILVHGDYKVVSRDDGSQLGFGRFAHIWRRAEGLEWQLDRDLWNQPHDPYDPIIFETDVQALADRWTEAYNRHDSAALGAVYTEEAELMMHGAPTISGRDAIRDFWAEDFQEDNPLTLLTVTHAVYGTDMMLVHGNYEVVHRDDGSRLGFGRFAHIWHDAGDGNWRLDRDFWLQRFEPFSF